MIFGKLDSFSFVSNFFLLVLTGFPCLTAGSKLYALLRAVGKAYQDCFGYLAGECIDQLEDNIVLTLEELSRRYQGTEGSILPGRHCMTCLLFGTIRMGYLPSSGS